MPPPKSQNQRQLPEAVLVERLLAGRCRGTPSSRPSSGRRVPLSCRHAVGVAVPGQVDLEDLADPPGLEQLVGLLDVRHAPLLRADLHDPLVVVLGLDDRLPLRDRSCVSGFSTYTSLPAAQASTVIGTCQWSGRADQDGVDVLAVEQLLVVLGGEQLRVCRAASVSAMASSGRRRRR